MCQVAQKPRDFRTLRPASREAGRSCFGRRIHSPAGKLTGSRPEPGEMRMSGSAITSSRRGFLGGVAGVSGTLAAGYGVSGKTAAIEHAPESTQWDLSWAERVAKA